MFWDLHRGGSGGFAPNPETEAFEILAAPVGAWPSWDHAFYNATTDSSLFGAVRNDGSVRVGEYVHSTQTGTSVEIGVLSADQHNAPAVIKRSSDSKYIAAMSDHSGAAMYINVSSSANDNSAWAGTYHIEDELGGTAFTYPFLAQLNDEASDPIYIFFRNVPSVNGQWCYSKSTSAGDNGSWAAETVLVEGLRYYARFVKSSETRIDMAMTNGTVPTDNASVYHGYYESGVWHQSDGTALVGSPPYAITDFTLAYNGATASEGARIPNSIQKVGSRIAIACPTFTGTGTTGDYRIHDWDGSAWSTVNLGTNVGMANIDFGEGGLALDPADLDHAAASIKVGGTWRMHDCRRVDASSPWLNTQITTTGDEDRYPWFIIDHTDPLQFIWQKGTFTTEDDFDTAVWGYGVRT